MAEKTLTLYESAIAAYWHGIGKEGGSISIAVDDVARAVRAHVLEEVAQRLGHDDIKNAMRDIVIDEEVHPLTVQVRAIVETAQAAIRALAKDGAE